MKDAVTRPYESPRVTDLGSISDHTFLDLCRTLPLLCGPGGGDNPPSTGFSN